MPSYEYAIVTAFTHSPFGGNPALIVFLDKLLDDDSVYANIAATFNQPIACFIAPASVAPKQVTNANVDAGQVVAGLETDSDARFQIRYWAPGHIEAPLCGHGTLATTFALLDRKSFVSSDANFIRYETRQCGEISARRVAAPGAEALAGSENVSGERIEIELPLFTPVPASEEVYRQIKGVVAKAFRKEAVDVKNVLMASESGMDEHAQQLYVVEVAEEENIGEVDFDKQAFMEASQFYVNIVTARSSKPGIDYTYRMFAPRAGLPEDHVCGSANCLMAPYWADKLGKTKMFANQVSKRAGELWVEVDKERRKVRIQGEAAMVSKGQILL